MPNELLEELNRLVGPQQRNAFLVAAVREKLERARSHALASFGAVKAPSGVHKDDKTLRRQFEDGVAEAVVQRDKE